MFDKNIIMIGDSITEGFDERKYLPDYKIQNLGVSGDSTDELLNRISPGVFAENPACIFLCIGTNDIARDKDDEYILQNLKNIINRIRTIAPEPKITVVSVFPTRNNSPRPNNRIRLLNKSIEKLTNMIGADYLGINDSFTDKDGEMAQEFTEDGLHLTAAAYRLWAEHIIKYLAKL